MGYEVMDSGFTSYPCPFFLIPTVNLRGILSQRMRRNFYVAFTYSVLHSSHSVDKLMHSDSSAINHLHLWEYHSCSSSLSLDTPRNSPRSCSIHLHLGDYHLFSWNVPRASMAERNCKQVANRSREWAIEQIACEHATSAPLSARPKWGWPSYGNYDQPRSKKKRKHRKQRSRMHMLVDQVGKIFQDTFETAYRKIYN